MKPATAPAHDSTAPSITSSIKELAARVQSLQGVKKNKEDDFDAVGRAWAILLDLDTRRQALPEVHDRSNSNTAAQHKVCQHLKCQHRSADAAELPGLVQQWLSSTHYVSRLGHTNKGPGFAAVPLSEQQAVLSLLLSLRGSGPTAPQALASLPALGSTLMQSLQHEAQAATAAAAATGCNGSSRGWVAMSLSPEELLSQTISSRGQDSSSIGMDSLLTSSSGLQHQAAGNGKQGAHAGGGGVSSTWVSPAAASMQLLLQMPLDAAAALETQPAKQGMGQPGAPDDVLIAAACGAGDGAAAWPDIPAQQSIEKPLPLLEQAMTRMQLASCGPQCLPLSLGSNSSSSATSAAVGAPPGNHAAGRHSHSSRSNKQPVCGCDDAVALQRQGHAISAAAAAAESAAQATSRLRPRVASLIQLSSAEPGSSSTFLLGPPEAADNNEAGAYAAVSKLGASKLSGEQRQDDTAGAKDTGRLSGHQGHSRRQQQQHDMHTLRGVHGSNSSSRSSVRQEMEAELVATACLALQGVWSAVQQLWDLVLQGVLHKDASLTPGSSVGLCRPSVQHQLLVQVLHTCELRLRLKAFLQHFQQRGASSNDSSSSSGGGSPVDNCCKSTTAADEAIQTAFVNAVASVLSEQDASLASGQVSKLQQPYQRGCPVSLMQLLAVHRGMTAQLQTLAELCWCTVHEYVNTKKMFLTEKSKAAFGDAVLPPLETSSSSTMNWHMLKQAHNPQQARAMAAGLQDAAAAAYTYAVPWPDRGSAAAAAQLAWAPSTWQLRQGLTGGHVLLEHLYEGVIEAGSDAAPLLRYLFAAAAQPVLQSIRTWAFLSDTRAAEAAAEATAMVSFTAGSNSMQGDNSSSSSACLLAAAAAAGKGGPATAGAAGGPFAAVAGAPTERNPHPLAAAAAAAGGGVFGSSGGVGGFSSNSSAAAKPWSGSKAAESAMRQVLQEAWHSVTGRAPRCPSFLGHIQGPAAVAGMQLHLLQLLGGPGQALAERLGWLADMEQQEIAEVLGAAEGSGAGSAQDGPRLGAAGLSNGAHGSAGVQGSGALAAAAVTGFGAVGAFMGLLCGGEGGRSSSAGGGAAGSRQGTSPTCNLTSQQLQQCADIMADFRAARLAETERVLQELAQHRADSRAAHELWLASRQEEHQQVEAARSRLQAEAAARRRQRQAALLAQQQEEVAAAQARRSADRQQQLAFERGLLQQAAVQEHQQALQHLRTELALLGTGLPPAAAAPAEAAGEVVAGAGIINAVTAGAAVPGTMVSGFAAAAGLFDAVDAVDVSSIALNVADAPADPAADDASMNQYAEETVAAAQQRQHQKKTWGRPVLDLAPAAGATRGRDEPLAVIGSAAAGGGSQAAGRRSNSQPKVLPGMGRSVTLSRRNRSSEDDGGVGNLALGAEGVAAAGSAAAGAFGAAGGRAGRNSGMGGAGGMASILGGFGGASAFGRTGQQQQGIAAKGKWGVPIVPGAAAGRPTLQRRASTGNLLSEAAGDNPSTDQHEQQQQQQHLQRAPSGGSVGGGGGWYGGLGSRQGSRPGTPRGRRASEHASGAGRHSQQQQQLPWQQSWHHIQQQRQQQGMLPGGSGGFAAAGSGQAAAGEGGSSAAAVASTGWLLSRHTQRTAEQGNGLILAWLLQQGGLYAPNMADPLSEAAAAADSSAKDAGMQLALSPWLPGAAAAPDAALGTHNRTAGGQRHTSNNTPAAAAAAAAAAAGDGDPGVTAAPMVSSLEVLVVQPILAQQRLTTVACWSLLLQEHRLLQRLSAIQGLFFQQQGDWVVQLADSLEPLLTQQQQHQQHRAVSSSGGGGGGDASRISPVVLQLLLESAVQSSCLSGVPEAERMSLKAVAGRTLKGWGANQPLDRRSSSSSVEQQAAHAAAAATDCLLLGYDVPWPVSLLLGPQQLQQYTDVFSVLLRLRRLQQQLMQQWQPLNHRASSRGISSRSTARRPSRHMSDHGYATSRGNAGGSSSHRRTTWHGLAREAPAGNTSTAAAEGGRSSRTEAPAALGSSEQVGLSRLQDLRRWHGLALHCIGSLLGYMLGELSGKLQTKFEATVGSRPVELPVMLGAHAKLLAAARVVCFLPHPQLPMDIAQPAYALVDAAWQLQRHVAQLLLSCGQEGVLEAGEGRVLVQAPSGFKEGSRCTQLACALAEDAGEGWASVESAGQALEQLVGRLKQELRRRVPAAAGHPLAGLAARLGV